MLDGGLRWRGICNFSIRRGFVCFDRPERQINSSGEAVYLSLLAARLFDFERLIALRAPGFITGYLCAAKSALHHYRFLPPFILPGESRYSISL